MINIKRVVVGGRQQKGKYISFTASSSTISVSHQAVEDLNITEKDKAVFFQGEDDAGLWYFSFGKEGDYPLKSYKTNSKNVNKALVFHNATLKDRILHSLNLPKKALRLWLSKEPLVLEDKKLWKLNYRD